MRPAVEQGYHLSICPNFQRRLLDTGPAVLSVMPTVISATVVEYRVTALVQGPAAAQSQVGGAYDPDALHVVIHGY